MKTYFIRFLGSAHINFLNIALYSSGAIRVEHVVRNNGAIAARQFESVEKAEEWFESFDGTNTHRTVAAMRSLGVDV